MRIKKHKNKNEYLLTPQGMWVRNFLKPLVPFIDINKTIEEKDHFTFLTNEYNNCRERHPWIDTENFRHETAIIVSDGYGFKEKQKLLDAVPQEVAVFAVHGALQHWTANKTPNYYVVNNPFRECMAYLPRRSRISPKCIASTRTNCEFLQAYRGAKYRYVPVSEENYNGMNHQDVEYQIDDYRNPICAAIGLAHKFGVEKLLLFCCDDSFAEERPGAKKLPNGMWTYQPQLQAHGLIDGCFHWLGNEPQGRIAIADHSSGPLYENAAYIKEDAITSFLQDGAI